MTAYRFRYQSVLVALCVSAALTNGVKLNVAIQSDMSQQTLGLQQPTSSQITYNSHDGVNVNGDLSYLLGPPIKMAQGLHNMVNGNNMAGLGQSLKAGGAVLGVDAKLLEAAGGAKLLRGGLLMGGAAAKAGVAKAIAGLPGKKIASIVELPVKVVAMKDIVAGKALVGAGKSKGQEAAQEVNRGDKLIQEGAALKSQGLNQVMQGATEGFQNLGSAVQQTTGNAATALKLLPIMLDMNTGSQPQQQQQQQQQEVKGATQQQQEVKGATQQQHLLEHQGRQSGGLTGPSLFGGLTSALFPSGDPFLSALSGGSNNGGGGLHRPSALANLFGGSNNQQHHGYAAVLNATNPLTDLLLNPRMNPFIIPITGAMDPMSNPVAGALSHPFGGQQSGGGNLFGNGFGFGFGGNNHNNQAGTQTSSFNFLPGLRFRETVSNGPPQVSQHQYQYAEKTSSVQQQQQHGAEKSPPQQQVQQQQVAAEKSLPHQQQQQQHVEATPQQQIQQIQQQVEQQQQQNKQ